MAARLYRGASPRFPRGPGHARVRRDVVPGNRRSHRSAAGDGHVAAFARPQTPGGVRRRSSHGGGAMNCSRERIEAYLDRELDGAQQAALEQHLAGCPDCAEAYTRLRRQQAGIQAAAPYFSVPPQLKQSIRGQLRRVERTDSVALTPRRWLALAASVLLIVSVSLNVVQWRARAPESDLADSVLSDHLRSLIGTHLVDVASSDRHTVKPWFAGKLDFSPEVKDLSAQGFPLTGGRVEYLEHRRVAALVYHRRQHVINLFIWPAEASGSEAVTSRNGYHLLHWTAGGMTYWAVSDVAASDLQNFRGL